MAIRSQTRTRNCEKPAARAGGAHQTQRTAVGDGCCLQRLRKFYECKCDSVMESKWCLFCKHEVCRELGLLEEAHPVSWGELTLDSNAAE